MKKYMTPTYRVYEVSGRNAILLDVSVEKNGKDTGDSQKSRGERIFDDSETGTSSSTNLWDNQW